jgi:hypothetical protein
LLRNLNAKGTDHLKLLNYPQRDFVLSLYLIGINGFQRVRQTFQKRLCFSVFFRVF